MCFVLFFGSKSNSRIVHFLVVCLGFKASRGLNFTQILHLYFTRVPIVSLAEKLLHF